MTEYVLGLVPDYGLYLVFGAVMIACLAVPLPASMLVLASGGFAAAGDLTLWHVITVTAVGFIIGDQIAFHIGRYAGAGLLSKLKEGDRTASMAAKSELMLDKYGLFAVLISHTIASPTCPYVTYISGATKMSRIKFSSIAMLGAIVWAAAYTMLGYIFAGQLSQVSDMLGSIFIAFMAVLAMIAFGIWLRRKWKEHEMQPSVK